MGSAFALPGRLLLLLWFALLFLILITIFLILLTIFLILIIFFLRLSVTFVYYFPLKVEFASALAASSVAVR